MCVVFQQELGAVLLALLPAVCVRGSGRERHSLRRTHLDADRSQRGPGLHEGEDPHQYVSSPLQIRLITVDNDHQSRDQNNLIHSKAENTYDLTSSIMFLWNMSHPRLMLS